MFKQVLVAVLLSLVVVNAINTPAKVPVGAETGCEICEFVVHMIEGYLENNATESQILGFLEADCKILGNSNWIATCQGLVDAYGSDLITYLVDNETPELACSQVGLCSSKAAAVAAPQGDIGCVACEFLVKQTENYLSNNSTEQQILTWLTNDCKILHDASWVAICQGLVSEYGSEIIQMLVNQEDPATICSQLKLCSSATATATKPAKPTKPTKPVVTKVAATDCVLCEYVVSKVESLLEQNVTESAIVDFLVHDCKVFGAFASECKSMVLEYAPSVINLLVNEVPPEKVCATIGLCTSASSQSPNVKVVLKPLKH